MSAHVISHQAPRRKRAGALIAAIAGVIAASWLALALQRSVRAAKPPSAPAAASLPAPAAPAATPLDADVAAGAPTLRRAITRAAPGPAGIPLDADGALEPAGYEILSAAELDDISQARDERFPR